MAESKRSVEGVQEVIDEHGLVSARSDAKRGGYQRVRTKPVTR